MSLFSWLTGTNKQPGPSRKPILLLIMDGFGLAPPSAGNAISLAKTPNYTRFYSLYPHGEMLASGESVGLPANEVGNTEVGHLTLGAGRVIYQDLVRINRAIEDGSFLVNPAMMKAAEHVRRNQSTFHIMGLIGRGKVHSSVDHLHAVLDFCQKEKLPKVCLHLFTDGRDSPPTIGLTVVGEIESRLVEMPNVKIASLAGRYWAMDRDRRWERTEKTYKALVLGQGEKYSSAKEAVQAWYDKKITDEFIEPTLIAPGGQPVGLIGDHDAVMFYNFRVDRPKQLTMAFVMDDFEGIKAYDFGQDPDTQISEGKVKFGSTFQREKVPQDLFFVTMTEYEKDLPVSGIAYGPERVPDCLPAILTAQGKTHMHMAESEKERFVKYYFNGLREEPFETEQDQIISSPKVATYDKKPEMSLFPLVKAFKKQLAKNQFDFFVMNFANADMVAHSGNLPATVKAIEQIDRALLEVETAMLAADGTIFITADHGNAEELITYPSGTFFYTTDKGSVNTEHSNNKVPLFIISNQFKGNPMPIKEGSLADIAPTILAMMGIDKPAGMTGTNLLEPQ